MSDREWFHKFFGPEYLTIYSYLFDEEKTARQLDVILPLLDLEKNRKILDMPCGFGRHSLELKRRGYDVTGVDLNEAQLKKAKELMEEAGVEYPLLKGDMRKIKFAEKFDVLLNLFTSFGYFSDKDNEKTAANFYSALKPGGRMALEIMNRDYIIANYQTSAWHYAGDRLFSLEERSYDPLTGRMNNRMIMVGPGTYHEQEFSLRIYTLNELVSLFEEAGFRYVKAYDGMTGQEFSIKSARLLLVMEKPGAPRRRNRKN